MLLRSIACLLLCAAVGCATARSAAPASSPALTQTVAPIVAAAAEAAPQAVDGEDTFVPPGDDMAAAEASDDEDDDDDDGTPSAEEGESHDTSYDPSIPAVLYTADLSDQQLQQLWKDAPEKLGSMSLGFVDEGRIINARQFPRGDGYVVVSPERTFATEETIQFVLAAIAQVRAEFPDSPPLRVNQISGPEGGFLRPHKSHQSGRDVDLAFYYPGVDPIRQREREKFIDVPRTWALLKAVVTTGDVQLVLLDRRVQKVLFDHALAAGEDPQWLDSLFHGQHPLVQHARRHRDHMHVRYFNARAQELGRRVAPLLALRPEQNLAMHRVKRGDTLGGIAMHYGSSIDLLRKVNRIKGSMLHIAQVLKVPLHRPCTQCPVPPPMIVPARRLPPSEERLVPNFDDAPEQLTAASR